MNKIIAGLLLGLFSFSAMSAQGNVWDIDLEDGSHITNAALSAFEDDTLTIMQQEASSKIWIGSIKRFSGGAKSNIAANIIRGTLVGAGAGLTLGTIMDAREDPLRPFSNGGNTKIITAAVGGALGFAIGSLAVLEHERVYQSIELEQLEHESKRSAVAALLSNVTVSPRLSYCFSPGIAIPVGDFGKKTAGGDAGAAELGFSLTAELNYAFNRQISSTSSFVLTYNGVDKRAVEDSVRKVFGYVPDRLGVGSWLSVWTLTGVQIRHGVTADLSPYLDAQIGILLASSASLDIPDFVNVLPATSAHFAFGVGGGLLIKEKLKFRVQYLYSKPEFDLKDKRGVWSQTRRQPTGLLQIGAGWMF